MALANYTDLIAAIEQWVSQNDIAVSVADMVTLAEAQINRDISVEDMSESQGYTFNGTGPYTLPSDFVEARALYIDSTVNPVVLEYRPSADFWNLVAQTSGGIPKVWTREGSSFHIAPGPSTDTSGTLIYLSRVPSLSAGSPTNWLLTKAPDLYLYASLMQTAPYLYDDKRLAVWDALYQKAKASLHSQNARSLYRPGGRRREVA